MWDVRVALLSHLVLFVEDPGLALCIRMSRGTLRTASFLHDNAHCISQTDAAFCWIKDDHAPDKGSSILFIGQLRLSHEEPKQTSIPNLVLRSTQPPSCLVA